MSASPGPKPAVPPRQRGKWLIYIAAVLVVLLVLPIVLVPLLVNPIVRPKVVEALRAELTGEPQIDRLSFSWFSGVSIEGFRIGNPPGFSPGHCISVDRVVVNPKLLALLRGSFLLKQDFRIEKPRVNVEQNAQGAINVSSLLRVKPSTKPSAKAQEAAAPMAVPVVRGGFVVEDFTLSLKTPALAQPVALSPIRVETRIEALDKPITLAIKNADGSLNAKGQTQIGQAGKLDLANLKAELDYNISPAFLEPLKPALSSFGPVKKFEGTLAGNGHISLAGLSRASGKGDLTLDIAELAAELAGADGKSVLRTLRPGATQVAYNFKPRDDGKADLSLRFTSPAASLAFAGLLSSTAAGSGVEGELTLAADLAVMAERFPGVVAADRKLQGRISGGVKNLKADPKSFTADLDVRGESINEVSADGAVVPLVKDLAAKLRAVVDLEKGLCRLDNLDAHVDNALMAKGFLRAENLPALTGQKLSAAEQEKLAANATTEADLQFSVDLDALMAKARRVTPALPPTMVMTGQAAGRFVSPATKGVTTGAPFGLAVEIRGFKSSGVAKALDMVQIPSGSLKATGSGAAGWTKIDVTNLDVAAELARTPTNAATAAQSVPLKLTGALSVDTTARRWSATNVKANYGGIGLSGQATLITPEKPRESVYETLRASTLKAALDGETDVKALMTAASAWGVPLGDLGGSGPLTAHVETDGAISSLACKPLRVESKGITLTGKAMESIRWPITLALDGSMTLDPLDPLGTPIQIQSATARGPGLDITTMKGVLALDPASDKTDLEIAGQFDPVALASALPGYFKEIALQSGAGPVSLRLRGSLTGAGTEVVAKLDLPETSVQIASAGQNAMALGKPALDVDAKVDTRTGSYQISRASLKTALVALDARADVALDKEGKLAKLDARADGAAELAKLRDLVVAMGLLTNTTELAGNVKLAANVTAGQGGFPYTIQASAPGLHFKGPQTGGVAIDEPEPVLNVKGLFANTKDGFMVSIAEGSELQMQTARAKLSGTLRKQKDQPFYADNLVADATYNPPKLKPLLKAFNAGEILATDQQAARLVFTGPLQPGKDIAAWLASLTLSSKMGYQAYSHTGVKVEGDPLAADMRAGKLPLDYTCKINGGSASVKGELNAQGPQSRAQMKVEKLALNVEMAPLLGYLSPLLFAKKGQLEGQASASFDGTWTGPLNTNPLPESGVTNAASFTITDLLSQRLSGRGQLAVKDLKITGAPLLNMILQYLGTGTDAQVGEIEPTDFVVEKGCLSYQKMVIKLSGMMITLSGKINFDQTMQMQISLPFPAKIREQNKELAKYLGESLTVPLTGTLSSPKLDTSQALQAALKDAGSKALKEKGGDMLKGLFNKSDKDAKPSGTTTPPSGTTPSSSGTSAPKEKAGDMLKGILNKSDKDAKPSGTTTPPSATTPPSSGTSAPKEKAGDMLKGLFKKSDTDKKPSGTTTP